MLLSSAPASDFRVIGAPGNAAMPVPGQRFRGVVDVPYRLGNRPVSTLEYCSFLNAIPSEKAKKHFHPAMRIQLKDGKYTPIDDMAEKPIIMLSYIDAAEYCNYMSGGPVYRVIDEQVTARDTIAVDSPRVYYIPTRNEWLKGLFFRNGAWKKYRPLSQAEMVEDLARTWYRAAVGKGKSPEEIIVINNYTTNNGGLSEDNIRKADVTLRLAATPAFSVEKKLDKPSNLYTRANPELELSIRAEHAAEATLTLKISDFYRQEIVNEKRNLKLNPGLNKIKINSRTGSREGFFCLSVKLQVEDTQWSDMEIPFLVGTRNDFKPVQDATFGLSTHLDRMKYCWGRVQPEDYMPLVKFSKVSFLRTDRPERSTIDAMHKEGIRILTFLPFYYSYNSYTKAPNNAEAVKWRKFGIPEELITYAMQCNRLFSRNPDISDWEIGNEPHAWKITAADYAQQAKTARVVAAEQKHPIRLVLGDMNFIYQSVIGDADAARFTDAVAIHCYGFFKHGYDHGIPNRVEKLKRVLAERGEPDKPVWMTEISGCGYWSTIYPGSNQEEVHRYQALDLPKKMLGCRALGVDKVFFYQFFDTVIDGNEGSFGLTDSRFFPKPALMVYRVVVELFEGAKYEGKMVLPKHITGFQFSRDTQPCAVIWREDKPKYLIRRSPGVKQPMVPIGTPEQITLQAATPVELYDLMGNLTTLLPKGGNVVVPVCEYPVFLRGDFKVALDRNYGKVKAEHKTLPVAKLQFLPTLPVISNLTSLHNMQMGLRMDLKRNVQQDISLRVHNLRDHAIEGAVTLNPPINFDDDGWQIKPKSIFVRVPANGTATVTFKVKTGIMENLTTQLYILGAEFKSDNEIVRDNVMIRPVHASGKLPIY